MTGRSKEETENITLLGNQKTKYPATHEALPCYVQ